MPDFRLRTGTGATEGTVAPDAGAPGERGEGAGGEGAGGEAGHDEAGRVLGFIHSAETTGTVNGPGVRYTLYLSGCPLRCLYCHNPDTWEMRLGERVSVDQVVADIEKFLIFLRTTGGGLTASGGEPLLQPQFLLALFRRVKELWGLHTALDTSGNLGDRAPDELLDVTDLVLLDVKSGLPDTYRRVTGAELAPTLTFGRRLAARGNRMWIRYVLVPGYTDAPDNLAAVADFVASLGRPVERVEVLPYHDLGAHKYAELGLPYRLAGVPGPTSEQVEAARATFRDRGLVVL
ncbi:MAG TPA: pyruvate formate-lyase-activating protein [Jiangellales bacterium]|nr:pyruvate formate-lyase-activating protein [Jiangellales bacterium]